MKKTKNLFRKLEVTYIYGETGTGKTRYVLEKYGFKNVFRVVDCQCPFDGYKGQDVIVFEEFRSKYRIEDMLNYLDVYPLLLPSYNKESVKAKYTKIYIISNWPLENQYLNVQEAHKPAWNALLRRIHNVFNFDEDKGKNLKCVGELSVQN